MRGGGLVPAAGRPHAPQGRRPPHQSRRCGSLTSRGRLPAAWAPAPQPLSAEVTEWGPRAPPAAPRRTRPRRQGDRAPAGEAAGAHLPQAQPGPPHREVPARGCAEPPTTTVEFLREAVGVVGRELSEELALNSSELRLSEASLRPLLMELLSSQLRGAGGGGGQVSCGSIFPRAEGRPKEETGGVGRGWVCR